MVQTRVFAGFILLCGSIVIPGYQPVKQWADGAPVPIPTPKGKVSLAVYGSPSPLAKPAGQIRPLD